MVWTANIPPATAVNRATTICTRPASSNPYLPEAPFCPLLPLAGPASGPPDVTDVDAIGEAELGLPEDVLELVLVLLALPDMLAPAADKEVDDPEM